MWIQIEDTIREHDKIFNLSDRLNIPDAYAIGLMVCLWTWASTNAPDGDLTSFPPRAIASAAKWDKPGAKSIAKFYNALLEVRFLEKRDDGRVVIRNWEKRASLIIDYMERQREKNNERVRKCRERKKKKISSGNDEKDEGNADCNVTENLECNVTVTLQNPDVTPIPNHTIPNNTIPNLNAASIPVENTVTPDVTAALRYVCEEFSKAVHAPSEKEQEQLRMLLGEYGKPALLAAVRDAAGKGRSVNYLKTILESWRRTGKPPSAVQKSGSAPSYDIEAYERSSIFDDMPKEGDKTP